MYYPKVINTLKKSNKDLRARRICWKDAHIFYDINTGKINYIRNHKFENGTITIACTDFIPSLIDFCRGDWEIFNNVSS